MFTWQVGVSMQFLCVRMLSELQAMQTSTSSHYLDEVAALLWPTQSSHLWSESVDNLVHLIMSQASPSHITMN